MLEEHLKETVKRAFYRHHSHGTGNENSKKKITTTCHPLSVEKYFEQLKSRRNLPVSVTTD
jgi:hypothetical protein